MTNALQSNSRNEILAKIRKATQNIKADKADGERVKTVETRLGEHLPGIIPDRMDRQIVDVFIAKAKASAASIDCLPFAGVGEAISNFLRQHNLPQTLRIGDDPRLAAIDWSGGATPDLLKGPSDGRDLAALAHAFGGVAETGTLILLSGAENPTTNNFLPENSIMLVNRSELVWAYEDGWAKLRQSALFQQNAMMPRTVNLITGPSRSADIAQTLTLGAHGPVRLHIIVVEDR